MEAAGIIGVLCSNVIIVRKQHRHQHAALLFFVTESMFGLTLC
jgi:hypothetical protein